MKPRFLILPFIISALLLFSSCASHQDKITSREIEKRELQSHVRYLSSRRLEGRAILTRGSKSARGYIARQFKKNGLAPYSDEGTYFQKFFLGTNVVGFIEGSDPELKNEVVVLSAHYDHLGHKVFKPYYPGANDNATGVAALIEVAEYVSHLDEKPKRTICFAAFDAEEIGLLGSLYFLDNFPLKEKGIVASVNMDMLGRKFFDCVAETVFAVGPESEDTLRQLLHDGRETCALDVLFLGGDLVGPLGDYYNFSARKIPSVMLSTGWNSDYHKTSDTWDKIDYVLLLHCSRLVKDLVLGIAEAGENIRCQSADGPDKEELDTVIKVTTKILESIDEVKLSESQISALRQMREKALRLAASPEYSQKDRKEFAGEVRRILFPIFIPEAGPPDELAISIEFTNAFPGLIRDFYRELTGKLEGRKFKSVKDAFEIFKSDFSYIAMDIADDEIRRSDADSGTMISFVLGYLSVESGKGKKSRLRVSFGFSVNNLEGTEDELINYCLLRWNYRANKFKTAHLDVYPKLLRYLTGEDFDGDLEKWKKRLLNEMKIGTEEEWIMANYRSANPICRLGAIDNIPGYFPQRASDLLAQTALDAKEDGEVRWEALSVIEEKEIKEALILLVGLLDDDRFIERKNTTLTLIEPHPLSGTPLYEFSKRTMGKWITEEQKDPKSIFRLNYKALSVLRGLTGKKYGPDKKKWLRYLKRHESRKANKDKPAGQDG